MAIVGVILLWSTGMFDQGLYKFGLNAHECAQNGFGAVFCGDELQEYQQHFRHADLNP